MSVQEVSDCNSNGISIVSQACEAQQQESDCIYFYDLCDTDIDPPYQEGQVFIVNASLKIVNQAAPWATDEELDAAVAALTALIDSKEPAIQSGTALQYIRGDKTLATFPTLVSVFTNDAGYATVTQLNTGLATKEPTIPTGTTAQYIRGDKSLATFPTTVSAFTNDSGYLNEAAADALYYKKSSQFIVSATASVIAYMRGTTATAFLQFQNDTSGTGSTDGITVGINSINGVVLNREAGALLLGVTNDFKMHMDANGNIILADSAENFTPGARFRIRGKNNAVALLVEDDAQRAFIRAEEVSGSLQLGFFNVSTVTRRLVPTGSSTDSVITALQELGLFRQS